MRYAVCGMLCVVCGRESVIWEWVWGTSMRPAIYGTMYDVCVIQNAVQRRVVICGMNENEARSAILSVFLRGTR